MSCESKNCLRYRQLAMQLLALTVKEGLRADTEDQEVHTKCSEFAQHLHVFCEHNLYKPSKQTPSRLRAWSQDASGSCASFNNHHART
mmetsp:Transcript_29592/g.52768  ORF Transcript_29592/g.52768 Transcript_29592/m.52768 type:complete len:88 (+) Transcript_29592:805-1068(+)